MTQTLDLSSVQPGFSDPVLDAQACFRKVLDALSRPGTVRALDVSTAPAPLNLASAGLALTLMDCLMATLSLQRAYHDLTEGGSIRLSAGRRRLACPRRVPSRRCEVS